MHQSLWRAWLVGSVLCVLFAASVSGPVLAASCSGPISLTGTTPYTQNFDTLATSGTTNALTIPGWCILETGTSASAEGLYAAGNGSGNGGNTYSFGATSATDRALGGLLSGTLTPYVGASFVNNTGSTITGLTISYRGEEWRLGTAARTDQLDFAYTLDNLTLDVISSAWVEVNALDFVTPDTTGTAGARDGNTINTAISSTISGLSIANGSEFSIRWVDANAASSDDGLAVDDFSITPILAEPDTTPPTVMMTTPTDGATGVAVNSNIVLTFSELVSVGVNAVTVECPVSSPITFQVSPALPAASTNTLTLNPDGNLPSETTCTVAVEADEVGDLAANPMSSDATFSFTTTTADVTPPTAGNPTPTDGATSVSVESDITVTFSESVTASSSAFTIECPTPGNAQAFALSGGPNIFTLNPNGLLPANTVCTVTVNAAQVTDAGDNPMSSNFVFSFTTGNVTYTRIRTIQGTGHISPLIGATDALVTNVPGIVTAKRNGGFYIQDPDLSGDTTGIASSEGIFVYTAGNTALLNSLNVGDAVLVNGTVSEFRPNFPPNDGVCSIYRLSQLATCKGPGLSVTEIVNSTQPLTVIPWACTGTCTITPIIVGTGGRVPPNQTLNTETANIETGGTFNPTTDGVDFYESLEGMRVTLNAGARVIGPSGSFSSGTEVWVVGENFANSNNTPNPHGGITITTADYYNPERIRVSTKSGTPAMGAAIPNLNVGATINSAINAVVDYSFLNFEFISIEPSYSTTQSSLTKEVTPFISSGPQQLTVATFNVENLGGNASTTEFNKRANVIVNNLKSPDILVLEEMQDNDGEGTGGGQAANTTFSKMITAISTAGGPTYDYRQIDPAPGNTDGGAGNGNIRVGFLFRTDRGIAFVNRTAGDYDDPISITCPAGVPTPNLNPGRIDPTNTAFNSSRKPIVGEFTFNGETFFIIGSHWNSKGGDDAVFGPNYPPNESSRTQRSQQATIVRDFINTILACNANANIIVAGDLNDYQFSPPVTTLLGTTPAMTVANSALPADERYSYVYNGTSQSLDHIVLSQHIITNWAPRYDSVHVNAEFFDQISDHDPSLVLLTVYDATPPHENVSTTSTPTLTWSHVTWAASYEIDVSTSNTFGTVTTYTSATTSQTIPGPGLADGTYFWRVRAKDASNVFGAYSATDTFTVDTTP